MRILLMITTLGLLPTVRGEVASTATYEEQQRRWTLANEQIAAQFHLDEQGRFCFLQLDNRASRAQWKAPEGQCSAPLQLTVDAVHLDETTSYVLESSEVSPLQPSGVRLEIQLRVLNRPMGVRWQAEMTDGQAFLRTRWFLRNTGSSVQTVFDADMLPWRFDARGRALRGLLVGQWSWGGERANFEPHEVDFNTWEGPLEAFTGAYGNHSTWGAVRDANDHGMVFGWEFDGRARAHAELLRDTQVFVVDSLIQRLNHLVHPGEEFAVPGSFTGLFEGDWDEAGYRTQRYVEAVLAARPPAAEWDRFPYVAFDTWGYQWDINEAKLMEAARQASAIGVELFVIDFGWAAVTGDWYPDPEKFPNGLKPIADYVHSLGMKFGLHIPFGEAMLESNVLRQNPDWRVMPSEMQQRAYFGAAGICLSHAPAREWVASEIVRLVREYDVDWLLQDGENMVKGCFHPNHTHHPQDSNYSNSVEGLNAVIDSVQEQVPDLMWENCEDGGNMQTYHMVQHYVTSIVNDNSDFLTTRRSVWGATFPFPPRYTDRYMEVDPWNNYYTRSHFFGGPLILMSPITEWQEFMPEFMKREIELYKSVRGLIRDGKVYHLTPPPDGTFTDAIQSHHVETDRSVIFVYRQVNPGEEERIYPRGLEPNRNYRVRFQDNEGTYTASGRELAEEGIAVPLPEEFFAEVVYIEPVTP